MTQKSTTARSTVQIDNDRVRVTEWSFAAGQETGHHRHEMDYLVVPMTSGPLTIIDADGGRSVAQLTVGEPYFRPAGVEHNVINAWTDRFRFIEVELKP
ncbi:MAG: cupin domain-containing protein [Rhodobacteraceae bacterium]|nr:cupin domain-containing protein [Paracoccaceae bacterium]